MPYNSMPTCLILGYGNTLRSDDGAGSRAAAALESELSSKDVVVIGAHQLAPEMAETVAQATRVLFLDASHTGVPGEIRCERIRRNPDFQPEKLTHELSPPALLELTARYFQVDPEAWLCTITGENFGLGERFSPAIAAAWETWLDRIRAWVTGL